MKVILVDNSMIFVPTVKVCNMLKQKRAETGFPKMVMSSHTLYFNSLLSCLAKIGVDKDDIVIMTEEGKSWRKDYAAFYKAQREGLRAKDTFTDWKKEYEGLNKLHAQLKASTNWYFIRHPNLEADDIIAIGCKYFKDNEVIIVSGDADLKMLCYYPNVKYFNTHKKINATKGMYEYIKDPIKIISDKTKKGDVGDNILVSDTDTQEDFDLRLLLVDLLNLPKEIEEKGIQAIEDALKEKKELKLGLLPEFKDVREKFLKIYKKDKVVTFEQCTKLSEKRILKRKNKK